MSPAVSATTAQQTKQAVNQQTLTTALPVSISGTSSGGQQAQQRVDKRTMFEKFFGTDLQSVVFVIVGVVLIYIGVSILLAPVYVAGAKTAVKAAPTILAMAA